MTKKFFLLSAFFLSVSFTLLTPKIYAFDTIPANEVEAKCPVACPCCDNLMGEIVNMIDYLDYVVEDYKDYMKKDPKFDDTQRAQRERADAVQRTQSSNASVQQQGWKDYNKANQQLKKIMKEAQEEYDYIEKDLNDLNDILDDLEKKLSELENCECLASFDECCVTAGGKCSDVIKKIKEQIPNFRSGISELQRLFSVSKLASFALIDNFNPRSLEIFRNTDKRIRDVLNKLPTFNMPAMKMLENCCKKGKEECALDMTGGIYHPLDWLIEGGWVTTGLVGTDTATGHFGNLTITNHTGKPLNYTIPAGTVLYPGASDVQRMFVTSTVRGTIKPGESVTVPLEGVCLDNGLFPPPSGDADTGVTFGNPFAGLAESFAQIFNVDVPGLSTSQNKTPPSGDSFFDVFTSIDTPTGGSFFSGFPSLDYLKELFSIFAIPQSVHELLTSGVWTSTGLPGQMEYDTLLQWSFWNIFGGFGTSQGEDKITEQVEESGGSQTPEQISGLNQNLWGGIDLVKKNAKKKTNISPKKAKAKKKASLKANGQSVFAKLLRGLSRFESVAHAQEADVAMLGLHEDTAAALKRTSFIQATFQNLVYDFEALVKTDYAHQVADVNSRNVDAVRKSLSKIMGAISKGRPQVKKGQSFDDRTVLAKIEEYNTGLVAKNGKWGQMWDVFYGQLGGLYEELDLVYFALLERSRESTQQGKDYLDGFSHEEQAFFKIFSRIKMSYIVLQKTFAAEQRRALK